MKDRVILHCDMNSFFCSVELLEHPELKDKPVAVAGRADARHGIILAKNQLAKSFGVATPEPIFQAMKKCPDLILLDPHHEKYSYYCNVINKIYLRYTDLVEPFSVDESWLDVTGSLKLFGKNGKELADEIRETVYKETGLTLSAGVSFNKTFAKMGSDYKKPFATTLISRENFKDLLWPLPAGDFFFVGKSTAAQLAKYNIKTIGDIANADDKLLAAAFGKNGPELKAKANGIEDDAVLPYDFEWERKSVGNGITFRRNLQSEADIRIGVTAIAERVAGRLRKHGLSCKGVKVDIKNPDFISISRQVQLVRATNLTSDIFDTAMEIIKSNWIMGSPIRLITITGINLVYEGEELTEQVSFFDDPNKEESRKKEKALEDVLDAIRQKHGSSAVIKGNLIDNDLGIMYESE